MFFCLFPGKPRVELTYDKMYTVTSRLTFTVGREDDGVPVICMVDHPAVKDFQAQKYLEVQCESPRSPDVMDCGRFGVDGNLQRDEETVLLLLV